MPPQPDLATVSALAELLAERNAIDERISRLIQRPATTGHIGEFIAAAIFDIKLWASASHKGHDGVFASGLLKGKTVNVKFYPAFGRLLDIHPLSPPDYYPRPGRPRTLREQGARCAVARRTPRVSFRQRRADEEPARGERQARCRDQRPPRVVVAGGTVSGTAKPHPAVDSAAGGSAKALVG